jgi:hypothetical protein
VKSSSSRRATPVEDGQHDLLVVVSERRFMLPSRPPRRAVDGQDLACSIDGWNAQIAHAALDQGGVDRSLAAGRPACRRAGRAASRSTSTPRAAGRAASCWKSAVGDEVGRGDPQWSRADSIMYPERRGHVSSDVALRPGRPGRRTRRGRTTWSGSGRAVTSMQRVAGLGPVLGRTPRQPVHGGPHDAHVRVAPLVSSRASPHHSSAMPTPPVKPTARRR